MLPHIEKNPIGSLKIELSLIKMKVNDTMSDYYAHVEELFQKFYSSIIAGISEEKAKTIKETIKDQARTC